VVYVTSSDLPNIKGSEFTIEAWVKRKDLDLNGGIFSRCAPGVALYVKNNEPKFAIIIPGVVTGTTSTYSVGRGVTMSTNT